MTEAVAMPRVAVIVLTWNGLDDLVTCLESFACVEYPNYELVVVDNGSADATVTIVRERYPHATLLANERNLGYVGGNNVGMRYALEHGADYIFVLNNDTKMTPNAISELLSVMQTDPRIAITGAKNLLMENPAYTWGKYGVLNWGPMLCRTVGRFQLDSSEPSPKDVEWVIGNGCMMRREALEKVGLFDEAFFQVNEDVDWCIRARKLGYRVVYVDTAAIHHKGGGSADRTRTIVFSYGYFLGRNAIMFARKHATPWQWVQLLTLMIFGLVVRTSFQAAYSAYSAIRGQRPFVSGVVDGWKRRLRREQTVRITGVGQPLPNNLLVRFLRWLGA